MTGPSVAAEPPALRVRTRPPPAPLAAGFSVVIPLYDKARYVQQAIHSVLAQSLPAREVIVVDDGSTDDGPQRVRAIRDPRVRLVSQPNAGVSVARNRGIELATSEWVVFLDADDLQHPRLLGELARARQSHPDAQVLTAGYVDLTEPCAAPPADWRLPAQPVIHRIDDLRRSWMRSRLFFTGTVAVQTRLLRQMQPCFPPGESYGEDLDLWFRLSDRSAVAHVQAPLAAYRRSAAGSLSARNCAALLPAYVTRMRDSAMLGVLPARSTRSALWYVAQQEIGVARELLATGQTRPALAMLRRSAAHGFGLRWLRTVAMACGRLRAGAR